MIYAFDDIEIDLDVHEVRRAGAPVPVEPQVFDVLAHLVEHRTRTVTKEQLLDAVWGNRFVSESALTSRIKAARRAVGDDGRTQGVIRTVHGRGYRFVATLTEPPAAAGPSARRPPRTRYASSGRYSIAYQVLDDRPAGGGAPPEPVVFVPGFVSNVELVDGRPTGTGLAIALAVAGEADDGAVLVTRTVTDLVAGSGLAFGYRGAVELADVTGRWELYAPADR